MNTKNETHFLTNELEWLAAVIKSRLSNFFDHEPGRVDVNQIMPPSASQSHCQYARFIDDNNLNTEERIILILVLAPYICPDFLDRTISSVIQNQGEFPQIGGVRGKNYRGILPTVETVLFILAGDSLIERFRVQSHFSDEHVLFKKQVINLIESTDYEPATSSRLVLDNEYLELFTIEKISKPRLSASFPAQHITTEMEWNDLVLNESTLQQIKEIEVWIKYNDALMNDWDMHRKIKPGYRCMFHGPPGTGKTLTACLLGKYTNRHVFRVDLSTVISKFIGETEKKLAMLFDKAESKDWILFFDEADALFGKRTNIRDAHDKYANQEVSYLLQRVENHSGLVILASNYKSNIDEAFTRRFQSLVYFPPPKTEERLLLWEKSLPEKLKLSHDIDLSQIASKHELTGANIINIVQFICLKTLSSKSRTLNHKILMEGIKKEYNKEGKII